MPVITYVIMLSDIFKNVIKFDIISKIVNVKCFLVEKKKFWPNVSISEPSFLIVVIIHRCLKKAILIHVGAKLDL